MGPPAWLAGSAVVTATLFLFVQTPIMAFGLISFLLVPAIAIWVGAGATSIVSARNSGISTGHTLAIAGIVFALFAAYLIQLQSRSAPSGSSFGGGRTVDPTSGKSGPSTDPPP
jgi:membrane associated rhomboid family serine protease